MAAERAPYRTYRWPVGWNAHVAHREREARTPERNGLIELGVSKWRTADHDAGPSARTHRRHDRGRPASRHLTRCDTHAFLTTIKRSAVPIAAFDASALRA